VDIHKPKPWHGLREFLKEYVIIVVGVLTALAAEAGVEWLHWRRLAGQHEAELRASGAQMLSVAVERIAAVDCIRGELKRMAVALRSPGPHWKGTNPGMDVTPNAYLEPGLFIPTRPWPASDWETTLSDGTAAHMSHGHVAVYAYLYKVAIAAQERQLEEQAVRVELTPLAFDRELTPAEKAHYLALVARMDDRERLLGAMARSAIQEAGYYAGLRPDPADLRVRMEGLRRDYPTGCVHDVDVEAMATRKPPLAPPGATREARP